MGKKRFWVGMLVYALVLAAAAGAGLWYLWEFLESYEASRPETAADAYVSGLITARVAGADEALLAGLDETLQSREAAVRVIADSLEGAFSWKRKAEGEYVLLDGAQVIGGFSLEAGETERFGFTPWKISRESFDFSYLMGEKVSVTVPEDYRVTINGYVLDSSYIAEREIPYPVLEEFYGEYEMPTMVRYEASGFLGEGEVAVLDGTGTAVTGLEDPDAFLDVCSDAEKEAVKQAAEVFLGRYVVFTGSANDRASENYYQLKKSLLKDSALAKRLYTAIDGLTYAQSFSDEIQSIEFGDIFGLGAGRYLCEAAYYVRTSGRGGVFITENRVKLILTDTADGLKIEAMTRI